jgi:NTP pyrophosphatase (non-canonical NTP hydrolase)
MVGKFLLNFISRTSISSIIKKIMKTKTTLSSAQKEVDDWVNKHGVRYFSELTNLAILMEETGELARLIAMKYGEKSKKKTDSKSNIPSEMGDILFVLICLANQMGISLEDSFQKVMNKVYTRDRNRHRKNKKLKK